MEQKDCLSAQEIIKRLALEPLPAEGGFYRETYRSGETLTAEALQREFGGKRSVSTAIYYMLIPDICSAIHRLPSDEMFHFYLGDPVTMLQLHPDGSSQVITLGQAIDKGQALQVLVPKGSWQGAFLAGGGRYALLGTTVAPGFEFQDYQQGDRETLIREYPGQRSLIEKLTHG